MSFTSTQVGLDNIAVSKLSISLYNRPKITQLCQTAQKIQLNPFLIYTWDPLGHGLLPSYKKKRMRDLAGHTKDKLTKWKVKRNAYSSQLSGYKFCVRYKKGIKL